MLERANELFDILDRHGTPLGMIKPRGRVHRDGDWHATVHVWIVTPARDILLQKRSETTETWPGAWDISAAGHLRAGDDAIGAAIREVREELGLRLDPRHLHHLGRLSRRNRYPALIDNEITDIYCAVLDIDASRPRIDPVEVAAIRFVTVGDFALIVKRADDSLVPHPEEYELLLAYLNAPSFPKP